MWRWDQGRLNYFSVENIRRIAAALYELNGVDLRQDPDPLRPILQAATGLPFAPSHYRVWRNYARVFKVLGLASQLDNKLIVTELCEKLLAGGEQFFSYDEYLQHVARTFYCPSPAFQGYDTDAIQVFPFCSILKLLMSKALSGEVPYIDLEEVFGRLIGNEVTGLEPLERYTVLPDSGLRPAGDLARQVREMIVFISQLSYLSWLDGRLILDPTVLQGVSRNKLEEFARPLVRPRNIDSELEIQKISTVDEELEGAVDLRAPFGIDDMLFTEGRKIRISHLRTERNRKVVDYYFENCANKYLCDVCDAEVKDRYPWVSNLIEVHHILPLSSPLHVTGGGTSIADLVGLCPNCHRATHAYYRSYLAAENVEDFSSKDEAMLVYNQVKESYVEI
ncbi:HNH endonuclease [Microbulbifer magnicolonia]|uniref:HNH endonuclease n=1 Tax=Microbulbifer magnicolonia TaxID=3109744 RepID=UPI002B401441|nr:HNH endonuclease [Microbulbifer sp. GG15]